MSKMTFSVFKFPENPESFRIDAVRSPEYTVDDDGNVDYQGLGPLCRTITGSGVFTGSNASQSFNALAVLMAAGTIGDLVHPVWGTIKACLTGLKMEQDSRDSFVAYSFTMREVDESGTIPKLPETGEV